MQQAVQSTCERAEHPLGTATVRSQGPGREGRRVGEWEEGRKNEQILVQGISGIG